MRDPHELDRISDELAASVESVAAFLIPDGKIEGRGAEWKGELPTCGKVSVVLRGAKAGRVGFWQGSSAGKNGGTLLSLFQEVFGRVEGIKEAKRFLGWSDEGALVDEAERERRQKAWAEKKRRQDERAARDAERKLETAAGIWKSTLPLAGSLAEVYLRSRGLTIGEEPNLRFHSALPYPNAGKHPALVARVQGPDGRGVGVWRIFLTPDGAGKADVENAKLGLGNVAGGAVRLGGEGPVIGIAEGVETALAARELDRRQPVWAGLSTSGVAGFAPPPFVKRIRVFPDGDSARFRKQAGQVTGEISEPPGLRAARALADRSAVMGIPISIVEPPVNGDYLDVLRAALDAGG